MKEELTFDRVVRGFIAILSVMAFFWGIGQIKEALIPFVIAFLAAYLLNPLVNFCEKTVTRGKRGAAVALTLTGCLLAVILCVVTLGPMISEEVTHSVAVIKTVIADSDLSSKASEYVPEPIWSELSNALTDFNVKETLSSAGFIEVAKSSIEKLLPKVANLASGFMGILTGVMGLTIIVLYLVFLLVDYRNFISSWDKVLPPKYKEPVKSFLADFEQGMSRYFRAQALVAMIVGCLFAVGFKIIGLPMGIVLGLFIGLLNLVPYLQVAGLFPAGFLAVTRALETGESIPVMLMLTVGVFIVVQIIQDAIITPRIMGDVTGFSPAIILLSLSIWGSLLGMLGLLIALPMTCLLWAYYQQFTKEDTQNV